MVDNAASMRFAGTYDPAELEELNAIDRIEGVFYAPLPLLLDRLADLALPVGIHVPATVTERAEVAMQLNVAEGMDSLGSHQWVRLAAGRWWLFEMLLAGRSAAQIEQTLHPSPGTRFCDWASWVDGACPRNYEGTALAALHIYATEGLSADGPVLVASGLFEAVGVWLAARQMA